jgi:hypothetical protein
MRLAFIILAVTTAGVWGMVAAYDTNNDCALIRLVLSIACTVFAVAAWQA